MKLRNLVIYLLLLAVMDVLIFVLVKNMDSYQLVSAIFINVAFVSAVIVSELYPKGSNSYVYSVSSGLFAFLYFFLELIIGVVFIIVDWQNVTVYIVQPVLFVFFVILMIMNTSVNFQSAKIDKETVERRENFTCVLYPNMQRAMDNAKGLPSFKKIENAYDEVRSLPTTTNEYTEEVDKKLIELSNTLNMFVDEKNDAAIETVCNKIVSVVKEKKTILSSKQI